VASDKALMEANQYQNLLGAKFDAELTRQAKLAAVLLLFVNFYFS